MKLRSETLPEECESMVNSHRADGDRRFGAELSAAGRLCALAAVLLVLPLAVRAEGRAAVKVGYYENEVFQEGARSGAIKTGYAYEYYQKLAQYTGWKYEYVYGEFAELYRMLLEGRIDLLAGLAWTKERAGVIGYPDVPMGKETYNLVKHRDDNTVTANPATLAGKTIGVLDSAVSEALNKFLAEKHVVAEVKTYEDYTTLLSAFDSGQLDVLAAEGSGTYGRDNAEVLAPFGSSNYFLCVSAKRPDLLAQLNAAQTAMAVGDPNFLYILNIRYYPQTISARVFSPGEKQWLKTHSALRVGFFDNYMPYSGKDSNGQVTGVIRDIIPEMLSSLGLYGLKVTYTGYASYDAMIADMAADRIDVAFPVGGGLYFAEENGLYQSLPVTSMSTALVYKGEYTAKTTEHFAVNEKNRMQYYFVRRNYPNARVTLYPSIEACLDAVRTGAVGGATLNGLRANDILKNKRYKELSMRQLSTRDDRYFGVKIGNEGLLKLLNRGLNVIGRDYAQNQSQHYLHALYQYRLEDVFLEHLGLFGSALGAVAVVIIALLVRDIRRNRRQIAEKEAARAHLAETNQQLVEHARTIEKQRQQESELREQLEKKQGELTEALRMAQASNRAKTTFLNNMSHDIRTPMNAIIGFTDLAERHIDDTERVRDCLDTVKRSSEHLLSLINDVLDMSRIESGRITLSEKIESLKDILHGIGDIVIADVRAKRHAFRIDAADIRDEFVYCDKLYLSRVLINLISNAIKYTPEGGEISVRIVQKTATAAGRGAFEFHVKDNGIGMSEEFAKTIFDPFTREEDSAVCAVQGTGLGMTITRNIVKTMGGRISVATKKGAGSEFVVSLDLRLPDEDAVKKARAQSDAADARAAFSLKGKKVLLVDDSKLNLKIGVLLLKEQGMIVDTAPDGKAAVGMIEEKGVDAYDFILMDVQMPVMGGYEATAILRKLPGGDKLKIIAFSANAFKEDREKSLRAGMNGHIAKPMKIAELVNELAGLSAGS